MSGVGMSARDRAGRLAAAAAGLLAIAAAAVAVRWGTFAAGGSDSFCYLGQAELWAQGTIFRPQDPGFAPHWTAGALSMAPTGFVPSPTVPGAVAPICPPGLGLIMGGAQAAAGRLGAFAVFPLSGAIAVWCAYALGRRLAGRAAGVFAAAALLASPIFLFQVVQPMSDVPAAAAWLAALAAASGNGRVAALRGGLAAGVAVLVRPNLLPLLLVVLAVNVAAGPPAEPARERARRAMLLVSGALPGLAAVLLLNRVFYGSFIASGYGDPRLLFSLSHVAPNLTRYPRWFLESHPPWLLAGLAAPFVVRSTDHSSRRLAGALLLVLPALLAVYLPYVVFESWTYLRFLLPGVAVIAVLAGAAWAALLGRLPPPWSRWVHVLLGVLVVGAGFSEARSRHAFDLRDSERRFVETAAWVDRRVPRQAVLLSIWHSGSLRYHGRRWTIVWDAIEPRELDDVLAFLRQSGRPPWLVLETWEIERFRERFGRSSAVGALDWPPRAQVGRSVVVWDPADRARYFAGGSVPTERVWTEAELRAFRRRPAGRPRSEP
jgi:hypothetical protein